MARKAISNDRYRLVGTYERLRKNLVDRPDDGRLDKALSYWVLPTDRRLPIAFLDRPLRDLLSQPFDELIATGKHFRQGSRAVGKVADMRESLDARREVLSHLSDLAAALLRDAGHSPTLDTLRRINTTLEAMSAYALLPDGPTPGRLTHDVDPPSFELLASLMSGAGTIERTEEPKRVVPLRKSGSASQQKTADVRRLEEARQAKIAAAKIALQDAKRALVDARARAQSVEAEQRKANADVKEAEQCVKDLNNPAYHSKVIEQAVLLTLDQHESERSLISKLFSELSPQVFSEEDFTKG